MNNKSILDSWKQIANYLDRDVRTCIRWEKDLGLPIHRIDEQSKRSKVFAYTDEIDLWLKNRNNGNGGKKEIPFLKKKGMMGSITISLLLAALFIQYYQNGHFFWQKPVYSLAVFPFVNQSGSDLDDYFAAGVMDSVVAQMSLVNRIHVISPANPAFNPGQQDEYQNIGTEVKVDFYLTGSVWKDSEKIKLEIKLIRAKDGATVLEKSFEGSYADLYNIPIELCQSLLQNLGLDSDRFVPVLSADYLANDYYLKAMFLLNSSGKEDPEKLVIQGNFCAEFFTEKSNSIAMDLFIDAIKRDPNLAHAYLGLARCYANKVNIGLDDDYSWLEKAKIQLEKAQSLVPDLPGYFGILMEIKLIEYVAFDIDTLDSVGELSRKGLNRDPYDHDINALSGKYYYFRYGKTGEEEDLNKALDYKGRSFMLNRNHPGNTTFTELLMLSEDWESAQTLSSLLERTDPSGMNRYRSAEVCFYRGDMENSRRIFQELEKSHYNIGETLYLGMIAAREGDKQGALEIAKKVELSATPNLFPGLLRRIASIYFELGMEKEGFEYLDRHFELETTRNSRYVQRKYLEINPSFEPYLEEIIKKYYRSEQ